MALKTQPTDRSHRWDRLAARLLRAERTRSWRKTHASFSSWVADLAKSMERSEATLWRALAAGRFYNEVKRASQNRAVFPALGTSQFAASPEVLELAAKIARVAPAEVAQLLTQKAVEGTISRRELRTYWETYRPVLNGQTARGRDVVVPRFNPRSREMAASRLEADCIAGLILEGSSWLGVAQAHLYKVIPIRGPSLPGPSVRCVPDVIVLYQRGAKHPLELHGVEVTTRPDDSAVIRHYQVHGLAVDYFWVVTPAGAHSGEIHQCPEIGLLEADTQGARVLRAPGAAKQNREETMNLLRILLAREVTT